MFVYWFSATSSLLLTIIYVDTGQDHLHLPSRILNWRTTNVWSACKPSCIHPSVTAKTVTAIAIPASPNWNSALCARHPTTLKRTTATLWTCCTNTSISNARAAIWCFLVRKLRATWNSVQDCGHCPFSKVNFCTWLGPSSGWCFEEHIRRVHRYDFCAGPVWTKSFSRFLRNNSYRVDFVMPSFSQWFCFSLIFHAVGKRRGVKVFHTVHCAGKWRDADNYYVKIFAIIPRLKYTGVVKVPCFATLDEYNACVKYMPIREHMACSSIRKNGNCNDMTIKVFIVKM